MTQAEYEKLCRLVEQWNENRLDLFHLSHPTKDLEIHGVMRFYFQDIGEKVSTKCIRVSSTATTQAVIEALVEKFLPDLKMLTTPEYSIWEIHECGEERKLDSNEKPLLVQLNWHSDDREGRFLLRKNGANYTPIFALQQHDDNSNIKRSVKRFSKRDKKELKKKHREIVKINGSREDTSNANDLYKQVPPTTFTRTISNPEIVMKKRREKKLETRLKEIGNGGSLKIYGGEVVPSRPYVTLLLSLYDRADFLLKETLAKYNLGDANADEFMLVEVCAPRGESTRHSLSDLRELTPSWERVLGPDECPLLHVASRPEGGDIFFALRRRPHRPSLSQPTRLPLSSPSASSPSASLVSLSDGNRLVIAEGVVEIGGDHSVAEFSPHFIVLPGLASRHAVLTFMDGTLTLTPSSPDATIQVNKTPITQTVIVGEGDLIELGSHAFQLSLAVSHPLPPRPQVLPPVPPSTQEAMRMPAAFEGQPRGRVLATRQQPPLRAVQVVSRLSSLSVHIADHRLCDFLLEVMSRSAETASFPLCSSFCLFSAARSLLSHDQTSLREFLSRIAHQLSHIAQESPPSVERLLFWLANGSELLHLLKTGGSSFPPPLLEGILSALRSLYSALCQDTAASVEAEAHSFHNLALSDNEATEGVLHLLDGVLLVARRCRLNAALTIQLSSHLFCCLNAEVFNGLLDGRGLSVELGSRVLARFGRIEEWAERVGVELAAECLLDRARQAATLLSSPHNGLAAMGATAYKLNSLQMRYLLTHLECGPGQQPLGADVVQRMVGLAERQADEAAAEEGEELSLEESASLAIPFALPSDGFLSDDMTELPPGLLQFLESLKQKGVCRVLEEKESRPSHPRELHQSRPTPSLDNRMPSPVSQPSAAVVRVTLHRGCSGIGLSIVAAQGVGDRQIGIYIKKVIENSVAARDGRLSAGDEILRVNGNSLAGLTQEQAAHLMSTAGSVVRLDIRKGAACMNGLAAYLNNPSPTGPPPSSPSYASVHPTRAEHPRPVLASGMTSSVNSSYSIPRPSLPSQSIGPESVDFASGSAAPRYKSASSSELNQDPNTSFSGRSIASSAGTGFSQLPHYYRRPAVVQPGRSCPSPSSLRHGAASPTPLRSGAVSPSAHSSLSQSRPPSANSILPAYGNYVRLHTAQNSSRGVGFISSPPLARSSPQLHPIHSRPSTTFDISPLSPSAISGMHKEGSALHSELAHGDRRVSNTRDGRDGRADWSVSREETERYRKLVTPLAAPPSASHWPPSHTGSRRETVIDDIPPSKPSGANARLQYAEEEDQTPSIVGAHEVYRDPRSRKLSELQAAARSSPAEADGVYMDFGDKMRLFAHHLGEKAPPNRMTESSAQRNIQH